MATKTKTLPRPVGTLLQKDGSRIDYGLYKYKELQRDSILLEGRLFYRYDQIKFLNLSQTALFHVVLARIPLDTNRTVSAIYLYRNYKQRPANFFQLNEYDRVVNRTPKPVWYEPDGSYFELKSDQTNDVEIFGTSDDRERKLWVDKLNEELAYTREHPIDDRSTKDGLRPRRSRRDMPMTHEDSDDIDNSIIYPFMEDIPHFEGTPDRSDSCMRNGNDVSISPRSSPPPLPPRPPSLKPPPSPYSYIGPNPDIFVRRHSTPIAQNVCFDAGRLPPRDADRNGSNQFSPSQVLNVKLRPVDLAATPKLRKHSDSIQPSSTLQNGVHPTKQKTFTWEQIFCKEDGENATNVLKEINQLGVFLVRNQSSETGPGDSGYVLSIFTFEGIRKYRIFRTAKGEYTLHPKNASETFAKITELCQHYINQMLPHSVKNEQGKSSGSPGSISDLRLTAPYSFYTDEQYYM